MVFKTVFGDGKGNEVVNIAKARQVLKDNRIKAKQRVVHTFGIKKAADKGSVITARLLYRSASQKVLNLIPNGHFEPLPIVEMAKAEEEL